MLIVFLRRAQAVRERNVITALTTACRPPSKVHADRTGNSLNDFLPACLREQNIIISVGNELPKSICRACLVGESSRARPVVELAVVTGVRRACVRAKSRYRLYPRELPSTLQAVGCRLRTGRRLAFVKRMQLLLGRRCNIQFRFADEDLSQSARARIDRVLMIAVCFTTH